MTNQGLRLSHKRKQGKSKTRINKAVHTISLLQTYMLKQLIKWFKEQCYIFQRKHNNEWVFIGLNFFKHFTVKYK